MKNILPGSISFPGIEVRLGLLTINPRRMTSLVHFLDTLLAPVCKHFNARKF